jgi:hypothetical protein
VTESSSNDPKNIWRSKETEQLSMSIDEIKTTARRFQTRGRVTTAFLGALFERIQQGNRDLN